MKKGSRFHTKFLPTALTKQCFTLVTDAMFHKHAELYTNVSYQLPETVTHEMIVHSARFK